MKQTTLSDKLLKQQQPIENAISDSYTSTMKYKQLGRGSSAHRKNAISLTSSHQSGVGPMVPNSITSDKTGAINFFNPPLQTSVNSQSTTNQSNLHFRGSSENIRMQAAADAGIVYEGRPKRKKNSIVKAYQSQTSHGHHPMPTYSHNNISAILMDSNNTT